MTNLDHTDTPASVDYATVYVAFELSKAKWMLGVILPGSKKLSRYTIAGGDVAALAARLAEWRNKAALGGKPVRMLSCYEAGFDGHWLHRWLTDQGVTNHEIDPSSIEVNRRARLRRLRSSSSTLGTWITLQASGSPRRRSRNARIIRSRSIRSVLARRARRFTSILDGSIS